MLFRVSPIRLCLLRPSALVGREAVPHLSSLRGQPRLAPRPRAPRMFFGGGDPFGGGGFPGMGGMGGKGGGRGGKPADTTKFYKLLEVDKNAQPPEIKKAYRKLAVKHHPDKGGDAETFKQITRAYEVLSDENKRAKYDRFGEEGLEDGGGGGGDPGDIFEARLMIISRA